ncbi:GreA/GreB family elongation factor [Paenibacillus chartarius]|uniref:GreA/GreB family elongation factor n=1 Tax=Paenibacillus chartarius TaxID=747481 RepID=A0ABV6DUF2_9BACL
MSHSQLSDPRGRLVNQLIYFDEQMPMILHSYTPREKKIMQENIEKYKKLLVSFLQLNDADLLKTLNTVTLIGSSVTICYEEEGTNEAFTVVLPSEIDPDQNRISFFSPIGIQLLSRAKGETFILQTPQAEHSVRIIETKLFE